MDTDATVGLAAAVLGVRAELQAAMAEGAGQDLRFRVGPVELEFDVSVARSGEAGAKVYVLSGKVDRTSTMTHRLKMTLSPLDDRGHDILVNGTLPAIPEF